jgi:hypothetical protein
LTSDLTSLSSNERFWKRERRGAGRTDKETKKQRNKEPKKQRKQKIRNENQIARTKVCDVEGKRQVWK